MNLPISLLVLVAIGQAATEPPAETSPPSQTVKRELFEGNYGQKTRFDKLGSTEASPGLQYSEELKQALEDPSSQHKIFGNRLSSIPKISDLLSGHEQPFEAALINHLYSPISVYNLREASNPFVGPVATAASNIVLKELNTSPSTNIPSRKEDDTHLEFPSRFPSAHNTELYSFSKSKHIPESFLQSALDLGSETNYLQKTFQRQNSFPETSKLLPIPAQELFRFPFIKPNQEQSPQYQQSQEVPHAPTSSKLEHEKEENNQDSRVSSAAQDPLRSEHKKPEFSEDGLILAHVYNSHPNGGISYASFTHNQDVLDRPKFQLHFPEQSQRPTEPQTNHQQEHVTQPQSVQQQVHPEDKLQLQLIPNPKTPLVRLLAIPQPQISPFYTKLTRQNLFPEYQTQQPEFQPLEYHYPSTISPPTEQTNAHFKLLQEPKVFRFPGDPFNQADSQDANDIIRLLPLPKYTPAAAPLKSKNQFTQTTTVAPQISVNSLKNQESSSVSPSEQTVIPLPSSPAPRQPLSTHQASDYSQSTTPLPEKLSHAQQTHNHNSVQVQQQELQEIHSELAPEVRPLHQKNTLQHRILEITPKKYQRLTTPLPNSPLNNDFEIEISSNIDPKQLPKDLRPVPTSQTEIQHHAEQTNPHALQRNQDFNSNQEQNLKAEQNQHQVQNQQKQYNQREYQNQQQLQYNPGEPNQQQMQYQSQEQNQQQLPYQSGKSNQQQRQYQSQGQNQQQLQYKPGQQNQQQLQYQSQERNQQQLQYQPGEPNQQQLQYQSQGQNQQQLQYQPREQNLLQIQYPQHEQIHHQLQDLQVQELQLPPQPQLTYDNANLQNYNIHQLPSSNPFYNTPVKPIRLPEVFSHGSEFVESSDFQRNSVLSFPSVQYFGKFSNPSFKAFQSL